MSKPTLGTKRVCPSCAARFYDLGRSPITCSVCQAVYPVTPPASSRRSTRAAPAEEKKPEVVEADPPVSTDADVISLDEAAEAEATMTTTPSSSKRKRARPMWPALSGAARKKNHRDERGIRQSRLISHGRRLVFLLNQPSTRPK